MILLISCLSLPAAAQMHSALELSVGGGWSSLGYKVEPKQADVTGANKGSWGLQAHVGYALFFTPSFGLGIGADFSHYGANATLTGPAHWNEVRDTEGERYTHTTLIHSLKDNQDIWFVEIPLTLYLVYPMTYQLSLNVEAGAKYGIPVLSKAAFRADVEHQGDYGIWGLNLHDVTGHGFYRETDFHNSYPIAVKNQISVFLKLGISYEIGKNTHLFANIYGNYGFTNTLQSGQSELGFRNDRPGMEAAHAFMADYNGIVNTNNLSAKSHPAQVGLEVGIRFVFPHKKKYPCKCRLF